MIFLRTLAEGAQEALNQSVMLVVEFCRGEDRADLPGHGIADPPHQANIAALDRRQYRRARDHREIGLPAGHRRQLVGDRLQRQDTDRIERHAVFRGNECDAVMRARADLRHRH